MKSCRICGGDASDRSRMHLRALPIRGWCRSCSATYDAQSDLPKLYLWNVIALVTAFFVWMGIALGGSDPPNWIGSTAFAVVFGAIMLHRTARRRARFAEAHAAMPQATVVNAETHSNEHARDRAHELE